MLNPAFGDAPARPTVPLPTSTATEPPISSYDRISVVGAMVVVVGAAVVVVGGGGSVVVALTSGNVGVGAMVVGVGVVVEVVVGAVVAGADPTSAAGSDGLAGPSVVTVVVGIMAVGVSVT